ncbi:g7979 [Coccomyxa viridis]|uniref:G7979 protein n=1 Tax=Coccomyxa viridis TaxID=1274662 RepID=A0ABP1FZ90_9CHLO
MDRLDRKVQQLGSTWDGLPADLLANVLEHLPRNDPGIAAIRQTCRSWHAALGLSERYLKPRALHGSLARSFPFVRSLDLRHCKDPPPGMLSTLSRLKGLSALSMQLNDGDIAAGLLDELQQLQGLTELDLSGSKLLCSGGDPQKWGLHRLQVLKMDSCPMMTDVDLYHAVAGLPELRCLSVQGDPAWTHHHRYQEQVPVYVMSAFAQCSKLERLDLLHQRSVTLEGLQTLSSLTSLQELALGPCPAACNDGAALLVQHSVLTKLTLHQDPSLSRPSLASRPFSAEVFLHIAKLPALQSLEVSGWDDPSMSADWSQLRQLSTLTSLTLSSCQHPRRSDALGRLLSCIPMQNLASLKVNGTGLMAADTAVLARAQQLTSLDLSCNPCLSEGCMQHLHGLTKLRSLKMDSCKALHPKGSDHFRFLAGMPGLTELSWAAHAGKPDWIEPDASVAGAEIGAMCLLMHAHKLTNLQRLDLSSHSLCAVDVTMSCIACLTSLTHLGLSRTYCSDGLAFNNSLAGLASLSRLRHLDLSNTEVDGSGLEKFCTDLQALESLNLSWTSVEDADMVSIRGLNRLTALYLNHQSARSDISNLGLAELAQMSSLRRIELRTNCSVTALGLWQLSSLTSLRCLDVSGCINVDPYRALHFLRACPSLQELRMGEVAGFCHAEMRACPTVKPADVAAFRAHMPFLHTIALGNQPGSQASTRLVEVILTGIEDATIGTIISWLELREKLPSRESLSSLAVLIAHALSGMHSGLRSALCAGWTHIGARR